MFKMASLLLNARTTAASQRLTHALKQAWNCPHFIKGKDDASDKLLLIINWCGINTRLDGPPKNNPVGLDQVSEEAMPLVLHDRSNARGRSDSDERAH